MIVEIDESKFWKRKYNVGRVGDGQWVFGGICPEMRSTFVVPVDKRDKNTLLSVFRDRIEQGSIITSDCWKLYNCLQDRDNRHLTVNHSLNFVDPATHAHTNTVKSSSFWQREEAFPWVPGSFYVPLNLDKRFQQFLLEVAELYNPLRPPQLWLLHYISYAYLFITSILVNN